MRARLASTFVAALILLGLVAAGALGLPRFTKSPKTSFRSGRDARLYEISAGCHRRFDRFVIRARGAAPGYDVRYLIPGQSARSRHRHPSRAKQRLSVVIHPARGVKAVTTFPLSNFIRLRCSNLREVMTVGNSGGVVTFVLHLRRMTGFRVFRKKHPTRIVVDVAHRGRR
jgi:hypothetical protein